MEKVLLLASLPISLLLIFKGSDWLTESLEPVARKLKTSNIAVGILLVSVVVSLPEIIIAVGAAWKGYREISLGVAFGSIIANIGLMTGVCALMRPLHVSRMMILRDGIISLILPILIFAVSLDGVISRMDGLLLFLLFIPYLINVIIQEKQATRPEIVKEQKEIEAELSHIDFGLMEVRPGLLVFFLGVALLLYGSYFFSDQLILLTEIFSLNQLFVGLTLGAIIPSLPNIAASWKATKKGLTEVAVSETIGSNVFTLLVTVGITSMISPVVIEPQWLQVDLPVMFAMSLLLVLSMITGRSISQKEGALLFLSYVSMLVVQTLWFMRP